MIPKREFNPELSAFSNLLLDLVDFKDRVRPLANDLACMDVSRKYQKYNITELENERAETIREIEKISGKPFETKDGYSSSEIGEKSGGEDAAVPDYRIGSQQRNQDAHK